MTRPAERKPKLPPTVEAEIRRVLARAARRRLVERRAKARE
jgi:hypothetical protein